VDGVAPRQTGKRVALMEATVGALAASSGVKRASFEWAMGRRAVYTVVATIAGAMEEVFQASKAPLFHETGVLWLARR